MTPAEISLVVAKAYGLTIQELMSKTRRERICYPRQVAMYLCRELGYTYHEVGHAFHKDHGTAMFAHQRISALLPNSKERADVLRLKSALIKPMVFRAGETVIVEIDKRPTEAKVLDIAPSEQYVKLAINGQESWHFIADARLMEILNAARPEPVMVEILERCNPRAIDWNAVEKRFEAQIKKGEGEACWEWQGALDTGGYGMVGIGSGPGHSVKAHRLSYALFVGPIQEGLLVCHHCDNPKCVRPDHLFTGTHKDNSRDMLQKGRAHFQRVASNAVNNK